MSFGYHKDKSKVKVKIYPCVSVSIRGPKTQTSKADRNAKENKPIGHGYTRMRKCREKIGTKLYGYVLAKRLSPPRVNWCDKSKKKAVPLK